MLTGPQPKNRRRRNECERAAFNKLSAVFCVYRAVSGFRYVIQKKEKRAPLSTPSDQHLFFPSLSLFRCVCWLNPGAGVITHTRGARIHFPILYLLVIRTLSFFGSFSPDGNRVDCALLFFLFFHISGFVASTKRPVQTLLRAPINEIINIFILP